MIPPLSSDPRPWTVCVRLADVQRGAPTVALSPDAAQRAALAKMLDLIELASLSAEVRLAPWLDGAELHGRWRAAIAQTCGVTAEPFETLLESDFTLRVVPAGSPAAVQETEVAVDLDAEDPPDVLDGDQIDLAAYVVEHLALEIDPFPRRPGATFQPPRVEQPTSPFAVLARLAGGDDAAAGDKG